jgi:hypothetical protein
MMKALTRTPVKSSVLASVMYLPAQRVLEVEFCSGLVYQYLDVPSQNHQELLAAESKGKYFNSHIRNHFVSRHIDNVLGAASGRNLKI